MNSKKEELAYRKEIRTYSRRLLSTALFIGYIATLVFNIPELSLYFAALNVVLSAVSLGLNIWSRADHFQKQNLNKQLSTENTSEQKKLTKIHLDVASSASFLIGGIASALLFESSVLFLRLFSFWAILLWRLT